MHDRFSADPTVVFMTSVLDDIETGKLQIPRFQRPLVWKWEQRRDFFSSVFEGLPIGALMIWLTEGEHISAYETLGPHRLPAPKSAGEARYLMDGVQRVSTLFGALRARTDWAEFDDPSEVSVEDFVVFADLEAERESERFLRSVDIDPAVRERDPTRFLPLNIILDSRELLKFQRDLAADHEARIDAADAIASAFRQYKIPLITLKSASLEIVTKSFERINSRGADMSELHMLNALTYSPTFDLLKRDRELRHSVLAAVGWHEVDSDVVLRCLKRRVDANIYKTNPDDVSEKIRRDPLALDVVFRGIAQTANYLRSSFGIRTPNLVPYRMQIVGLTEAKLSGENDTADEQLSDWFWLTTYTEAFGSSARQTENALADLNKYVETGVFSWSLKDRPVVRPLRNLRTDFRSARVKALAFALARSADDAEAGAGQRLLLEFGREAFCQVPLDVADRSRAAFRFLLPPGEAYVFKSRLLTGDLSDAERLRHLISDEASEAAEAEDMDYFAYLRERDMFSYEREAILNPLAERLKLDIGGVTFAYHGG